MLFSIGRTARSTLPFWTASRVSRNERYAFSATAPPAHPEMLQCRLMAVRALGPLKADEQRPGVRFGRLQPVLLAPHRVVQNLAIDAPDERGVETELFPVRAPVLEQRRFPLLVPDGPRLLHLGGHDFTGQARPLAEGVENHLVHVVHRPP